MRINWADLWKTQCLLQAPHGGQSLPTLCTCTLTAVSVTSMSILSKSKGDVNLSTFAHTYTSSFLEGLSGLEFPQVWEPDFIWAGEPDESCWHSREHDFEPNYCLRWDGWRSVICRGHSQFLTSSGNIYIQSRSKEHLIKDPTGKFQPDVKGTPEPMRAQQI